MDLTADFTRAQAAYAERLAYATAHRQQERWSKGPLLHAEPFDFERQGFAPGRVLPNPPTAAKNTYNYWLDEHQQVLTIRKSTALANQFYEEFFFAEDGLAKSCLYDNTHRLQNVKTRVLQNGRIQEVFLLGRRGAKHETYHYADDQLIRIHGEQRSGEQAGPSYTTHFRYQHEQLHQIVTEFANGYQTVNYQAR